VHKHQEADCGSSWTSEAVSRLFRSSLTHFAQSQPRPSFRLGPRAATTVAVLRPHLYSLVAAIVTVTVVLSALPISRIEAQLKTLAFQGKLPLPTPITTRKT